MHIFLFQVSSVAQSCLTLCDCMDCSKPGLPVHHQLQELAQTHVHGVGDALQPSHPLSSPSPPALNLSQHQGLFQWVSSSHQVAKKFLFAWVQSWYVIKCLYITKKEKLSNRSEGSFTKGVSTYWAELRSWGWEQAKPCGEAQFPSVFGPQALLAWGLPAWGRALGKPGLQLEGEGGGPGPLVLPPFLGLGGPSR